MPVDYSIDPALGVVFSRWSGLVTTSEIIANAEQLREDPEFEGNYSELVDMRDFSGTDATSACLDGIIRRVDPYSVVSRHAVLAPGRAAFGIARMYQILRGEGANCEVFRKEEEARRWLGLGIRKQPQL